MVSSRPPHEPREDPDVSQDFDDISRITESVRRGFIAMGIALPVWFVLLLVLGRLFGVGPVPFVLATAVWATAAWWTARRRHPVRRANGGSAWGGVGIPPIAIAIGVAVLIGYLLLALWLSNR